MPPVLVSYLVATAAYAGFQWTVHVLVYRQFGAVPAAAFPAYERLHQRRISYLVGPLFAAMLLSAGWLILDRPPGVPVWATVLAGALALLILGVTAFVAVPLHTRLSQSWDEPSYRRLLRADLVRTVAATAAVVLAVAITAV